MTGTLNNKTQGLNTEVSNTLAQKLSAVRDALYAMPLDANGQGPRSAFMRTDPVVATLRKQILDARAQYNALLEMSDLQDPMVDALTYQLEALEQALATRLAQMRETNTGRSRTKQAALATREQAERLQREEERLLAIRMRIKEQKKREANAALWLWAAMLLGLRPMQHAYAPKPAFAL